MTRRKIVMKWWNDLIPKKKKAYIFLVFDDKTRSHKTLTGREIETIYYWEHAFLKD